MPFLVTIPVPPSVNAMYGNRQGGRRGRYKTKAYTDGIEAAGWEIKSQNPQPVTGPYSLYLSLPKIRGDADNRIKAVSDLLVSMQLTPDDQHCVRFTVEKLPELECATVSVEESV